MANGNNDWDEFLDWSDTESQLFEDMAHGTDALDDPLLQALYNAAYFDMDLHGRELNAVREALHDYVLDQYDFDFAEFFDWEAWREAYA